MSKVDAAVVKEPVRLASRLNSSLAKQLWVVDPEKVTLKNGENLEFKLQNEHSGRRTQDKHPHAGSFAFSPNPMDFVEFLSKNQISLFITFPSLGV